MTTVEEVIAKAKATGREYIHDTIQFLIDNDLRIVSIPSKGIVAGVVGDKDVNRINFKMNRYYHGFDMSKFKTKINYINANKDANYYLVNDITVENNMIYFTWLVGSDVAAYPGAIAFTINMIITDSDDSILQSFNTTNSGELKILDSIQIDDYVPPEKVVDIISHIENQGKEECEKITRKAEEMIPELKKKLYITDQNSGKVYFGELKIIDNKPVLIYEEAFEKG